MVQALENPLALPALPALKRRLRVQKATPRDFLAIQMWQIKIEFFYVFLMGEKTTTIWLFNIAMENPL